MNGSESIQSEPESVEVAESAVTQEPIEAPEESRPSAVPDAVGSGVDGHVEQSVTQATDANARSEKRSRRRWFFLEWFGNLLIAALVTGVFVAVQEGYEDERTTQSIENENARSEADRLLAEERRAADRLLADERIATDRLLADERSDTDRKLATEQFEQAQRLENLRFVRSAILLPNPLEARKFDYLDLYKMPLGGLDLALARFFQADLSKSYLDHSVLVGAFIVRSKLIGASLVRASLVDSVLWSSDFTDADLTGTIFIGADLSNAIFIDATITGETDFTNFRCGLGQQPTWPDGFEAPSSPFCRPDYSALVISPAGR